jgi:uncharacterized membrane protein
VKKQRSFIVSGHESFDDAERALAALEELLADGVVKLDDAAIVVKVADDQVELHQRQSISVGGGVVAGGVAGILGGILLGFPVAGALLGMAAGSGVGLFDTGIDDSRMKELGKKLPHGGAALCVLVAEADWPALRERMAPYVGELLVVELTPEAEAALGAVDDQPA